MLVPRNCVDGGRRPNLVVGQGTFRFQGSALAIQPELAWRRAQPFQEPVLNFADRSALRHRYAATALMAVLPEEDG